MGQDLLQNLICVLFRQHKYAVSVDIEGMFLQMGVLARDQISPRFLWREYTTSDVVVHQYTRVTLAHGIFIHSPISRCQKTATDIMSEYPEAASVVSKKFYVDNYLDSIENVTHAIENNREFLSLLRLGGFNLTKFVRNADEFTLTMNPEDCKTSSSPIKNFL